jgi:4-amino-4-deoxy-L-arabinose transferase-like glycosyltransferase
MDSRKLFIYFLIALILFGITIRFLSINKDISTDESDFVKAAIALDETGHPVYYHSGQQPNEVGLQHPPMYIFLLSGIFSIFGVSEASARSINILFSLLTAVLIYLFCTTLVDNKNKKVIGLASAAFFLVNYFVFSSSLIIDIDALSTFFVFAFVFMILLYNKTRKSLFLYLAGAAFFFSISNRYPIAIFVYVCLGAYFLFNKNLRPIFWKYLLMGVISSVIFIILWAMYSIIIEPGNFFFFITHNARLGSEQFKDIAVYLCSFALNISQFIRLFTFPATLLLLYSFFFFFKKKDENTRIVMISVLAVLFLFLAVPRPAFGYPRYFMTLLAGASLLIVLCVWENLPFKNIEKRDILISIVSFFISLILLFMLSPQLTVYASNGLIKSTNLPDFVFNLLASLPVAFAPLYKGNKKKIVLLILLALTLSYSLYFDIKLVSNETHIKEAGIYLNQNTVPSDIIICPKGIGYYTGREFYANDLTKPSLNFSLSYLTEYFKMSMENRRMDDIFFWSDGYFSGINNPVPSEDILNKVAYVVLYHPVTNATPEKIIGDLYIYRLNQQQQYL